MNKRYSRTLLVKRAAAAGVGLHVERTALIIINMSHVAHIAQAVCCYRSSSVVVLSVGLSVRQACMHCGKTADSSQMPFALMGLLSPRARVIRDPDLPGVRG